ncbi:hypothetical protein KBD20_01120 [Candidatus Saccharibacteria bacterium]|nr:hypothetical protein [Candidatus Saccharibacteria bacterium]
MDVLVESKRITNDAFSTILDGAMNVSRFAMMGAGAISLGILDLHTFPIGDAEGACPIEGTVNISDLDLEDHDGVG